MFKYLIQNNFYKKQLNLMFSSQFKKVVKTEWHLKTFELLDTQAKGYLLKKDIIEIVDSQGIYSHQSLRPMIEKLE